MKYTSLHAELVLLAALAGCIPGGEEAKGRYPQTRQEWKENPAAALMALERMKVLLKEPIAEEHWDRALKAALDVMRRGCETRVDLLVDAFVLYAHEALRRGRPIPERLRKLLLEEVNSLLEEHELSRGSARSLWDIYMRVDPAKDEYLEYSLSRLVTYYSKHVVDLACRALDSDDRLKLRTALRALKRAKGEPEVDWIALHRKWKDDPYIIDPIGDQILACMVVYGDAEELDYVEETVKDRGGFYAKWMVCDLGERWKRDGAFEARLGRARRACENGTPTKLQVWTVSRWGDERDLKTMASLMVGPRSEQIASDILLFAEVSTAMAVFERRCIKALPFTTAEEKECFLSLDEIEQMAVLLSHRLSGLPVEAERLWAFSEDDVIPQKIRAVAKAVYAFSLMGFRGLDHFKGLKSKEKYQVPGGKEELLRRMQAAREAVFAQENIPLRAKHIMARAMWTYKHCRPDADLPPIDDPLEPDKIAPESRQPPR